MLVTLEVIGVILAVIELLIFGIVTWGAMFYEDIKPWPDMWIDFKNDLFPEVWNGTTKVGRATIVPIVCFFVAPALVGNWLGTKMKKGWGLAGTRIYRIFFKD